METKLFKWGPLPSVTVTTMWVVINIIFMVTVSVWLLPRHLCMLQRWGSQSCKWQITRLNYKTMYWHPSPGRNLHCTDFSMEEIVYLFGPPPIPVPPLCPVSKYLCSSVIHKIHWQRFTVNIQEMSVCLSIYRISYLFYLLALVRGC